ncbi:hypothetical protein [Naasia sp. SYSU D00057]|uniref:hypothetical protein n=1 Tax=Naasia sp. SYSU D00057 TaxID=2817380 RepID=UPI001B301BC4|nr:hypothetical protein [Naasia sp. SYSU D00057]
MRTLRLLLPAAVAAVVWLLSGYLELLGRQLLPGPVRHVLSLLTPETVPLLDLTAPAPWSALLTALSALALAAAYATFFSLVRGDHRGHEGRGSRDFAAFWFCAVAAGSCVAAVPAFVVVVVALRERQAPFALAAEHLVAVAHWGLVWGWLPALLAVLLDRRSPTGLRMRRIAPIAAGVFLVAAIGLIMAQPGANAARQEQSSEAAGLVQVEVGPMELIALNR